MFKHIKQPYAPPCVLQTQEVRLERVLLNSIVDRIYSVETTGQEQGGFYEAKGDDFNTSTFNHEWQQ